MQEFLFGAAKNLGAAALVDAIENMLDLIRMISQHDCLVSDTHNLRARNGSRGAECAAHHGAMVAASRAVRACFDQLDLDARRATAELTRHRMCTRHQSVSRCCNASVACDTVSTPDIDQSGGKADYAVNNKNVL